MFQRFLVVGVCVVAMPLCVIGQSAGQSAGPSAGQSAGSPQAPAAGQNGAQSPAAAQTPHVVTDPDGLKGWRGLSRPFVEKKVAPVDFDNSARVHDLIRAGNLYLSLSDAVALAIQNNLDIELQRYALPMADAEVLRAQGGGQLRGVLYTLNETPTGIGGPNSPLVTTAATQSTPGTSVATSANELALLGEPQVNYSTQGTIPLSNGSQIPVFDPFVSAQYNFEHMNTPQLSSSLAQSGDLEADMQTANVGYNQGFSTGANVSLNYVNTRTTSNSLEYFFNPFINSGVVLNVTQPLMRGFGRELNRRFIRIAGNEQKITSLLFRQQLIATVYGVVRLYTDLVALAEDVKVKQDTYEFARTLLQNTQDSVNEGTQAPIELTRARAQVSATQQDLINSQGLLDEQEAILKNVITRLGAADPQVRSARIVATDPLDIPASEEIPPIEELLNQAYRLRPDLAQAGLQTENTRISLEGSRNALRPELDLVGTAQSNALAGDPNSMIGGVPAGAYVGGYGSALEQIFTGKNPTVAIGLQLTLPVRNRVAQSDAARDELQLRQTQIRERQLRNQAQLEVEDALIGMRRARGSYDAAVQTRKLQEESLEAEQIKFMEGASTSFFVIQYQSYVAQARSTELAAKGAYLKAKASLQRAVGSILDDNGVSFDAAARSSR
jgi:outer membrane protein TolC